MSRRDGSPVWVQHGQPGYILKRADLTGKAEGAYNEAWLQRLLHDHPEVLPIEQIEPDFGHLIPVCRELPLVFGAGKSGTLDNLLVTAGGGLVLVEAKLWRNPEARREVVAQAMDYAAAVFRMSYEALDMAAGLARKAAGEEVLPLATLVGGGNEEFEEAEFIDSVSRNLRRGRAIVAVVGDGIREDILPLADLLQSHAGLRFVFALVELGVYETPIPGVRVVNPSILAQTTLIERGVVRIEEPAAGQALRIAIGSLPAASSAKGKQRAFGLSEDVFYDQLDQREPGLSKLLRDFLDRADSHGLYPDLQGGLSLKHASPEGNPLNLGAVRKSGLLDTGPASWWNRTEAGRAYSGTLADLIGGTVKESEFKAGRELAVRTALGKMPRLSDLLPRHTDAWLATIDTYVASFFKADP